VDEKAIILSTSDKSLHLIDEKKMWSKPFGLHNIKKVLFHDNTLIVFLIQLT